MTDRPVPMRTLAVALLATLLVWNVPYANTLFFPFKLLATWLHEMSHGLVMIVTGAGLSKVLIYRDTSGLAYAASSTGPIAGPIVAAAGYMGTPLWGAAMFVLSPTPKRARIVMLVFATLLIATAILVVDNEFGANAIIAIGVGVAACGVFLPGRWRVATAHFLAAQACINALLDIRVLLRATQVVGGQELRCDSTSTSGCSDAHNMARYTFGTTDTWGVWTWAAIWLAWSLLCLYVAIRVAQRMEARRLVKKSGVERASSSGT